MAGLIEHSSFLVRWRPQQIEQLLLGRLEGIDVVEASVDYEHGHSDARRVVYEVEHRMRRFARLNAAGNQHGRFDSRLHRQRNRDTTRAAAVSQETRTFVVDIVARRKI